MSNIHPENDVCDDELEPSLDLYYEGQAAVRTGDIEKAIDCFIRSVAFQPHFKAYETLYKVLTSVNKHDEASTYIEMAYTLNPQNDKTSLLFAQEIFRRGDAGRAREIAETILERNHSYAPAKRFLIQIQSK